MSHMTRTLRATASGAVLTLALTSAAGAQTDSSPSAPNPKAASTIATAAPQEVVVTASRVTRPGYTAPTPITAISQAELKAAEPTTLADAVLQLPALRASNGPTQNSSGSAGGGNAYLNLRSLGIQRTLVLLDGQRFVPAGANGVAGAVDINLFPSTLIQRVDVVTGGASAAYGSDAVSGVVNFVLDKKFTGLSGEVQGGVTRHGDDKDGSASVAYGTDFLGKGHFIASFESTNSDGIANTADRPLSQGAYDRIPNGTITNSFVVTGNVRSSVLNYQGLITTGAAKGTTFTDAGAPTPFTYGTLVSSSYMVGGSGVNPEALASLAGSLDRKVAFARGSWDFNDHFSAYLEANYGDVKTGYQTGPNSATLTIKQDNAYLPAAVRAVTGTSSFSLGKYDQSLGNLTVTNESITQRIVGGFTSDYAGWKIDGYFEHGQSVQKVSAANDLITGNYALATDAVLSGGQVVCRSTLTAPTNGCVAYNPFGQRAPTTAQLAYLVGTSSFRLTSVEDVASVNVSGEPFSVWAGPVSVAAGLEYRRESIKQTSDPLSQATNPLTGAPGVFRVGNYQPSHGSVDDKEIYAETVVPLVKSAPYIDSLELNGAVRYTDYSLSGGVTTWKVGLSYKPIADLRLRATQSRDIRAPGLDVLFITGTQNKIVVTDPTAIGQITSYTVGNPNLKPEEADTSTIGLVYQPSWLNGFSASIDAYKINVSGAISTLSGAQEVTFCQQGIATYCNLEIRNSSGALIGVNAVSVNLSSLKTSGIDLEASYRRSLSTISPRLVGNISFRALASYVDTLVTNVPGVPSIDNAGDVSALNTVGVPHWRATYQVGYTWGGLSVFVQERFVGGGKYYGSDAIYAQTVNPPHIAGLYYTDLKVSYTLPTIRNLTLYAAVTNLFDKNPPVDPIPLSLPQPTNGTLYDTVGQTFHAGVDFKF